MACEGNPHLTQLLENEQAFPKIHHLPYTLSTHTQPINSFSEKYIHNSSLAKKPNYQLALDTVSKVWNFPGLLLYLLSQQKSQDV